MLSKNFTDYASQMQRKIIREYKRLGIKFAIPSFAGHVPVAFKRIFPNATFQSTSGWIGFPSQYCCPLFIDPTEELFHEIGTKFLSKAIDQYGTSHIYFADPFNELTPASSEPEYLTNVSQAIFDVMEAVDSKATWLLQGWMFYNEAHFWQLPQMEAFLTAVPKGKILVLDLHSDQFPQYERTKSYFGQPFIWCMLHNFGGNLGLHGSADLIVDRARDAFNNENLSMVGVGITPEGINQNHVMYELALDMAWFGKRRFNTDNWFVRYGERRYGVEKPEISELWSLLHQTVYNYNGTKRLDGVFPYLVVDTPSTGHNPWVRMTFFFISIHILYLILFQSWFNPSVMEKVLKLMQAIDFNARGDLFNYDTVDFTRQYLQNMIDLQYIAIQEAYREGQREKLYYHMKLMLNMIKDLDEILRCDKNFLLGPWLEAAKSLAGNNQERALFEYNARNQITLWGPSGQINNYAIKQWAGLVEDVILKRWQLFLDEMKKAVENEWEFDEGHARSRIFNEIELPFNNDTRTYSTSPSFSGSSIMRNVLEKYSKLFIDSKWLDTYLNKNALLED